MESIHVVLSPEIITYWFGIPITNTLITTILVMVVLTLFSFWFRRKISIIPGKFQVLIESVFSWVMDYMTEVLEDRRLAKKYFPLIITLFIYIFVANELEFLPGMGSIGIYHGEEFIPLLRSVNTDLNVTLALATIAFLVIEFSGVFVLGFLKYFSKFVNLKSPLNFVVGVIELFSEIGRLIAFSFRLFGNIFAGKVLIGISIFFLPYVVPTFFMLFEVFVGFIQAAIFALLTLFFIKIAIASSHH